MLSPNTLSLYAALSRWFSARKEGLLGAGDVPPVVAALWLVRFKGRDRDGLFDRPAYLCLTQAEAKMVAGTVHGPNPVRSPVTFEGYTNVRIELVSLRQALADEALCRLLHGRMEHLVAYAAQDYERATQAYLCLEGACFQVLLWDGEAVLIEPDKPRERWPRNVRWKEPQVVWDETGLAGVMGPDGQLVVPCQYSSLREKLGTGLLEALRGPLPEIREPVDARQLLHFSCDVIDSQSGQRINPPGVSALWASLAFDGVFVAVHDAETPKPSMTVGFIDKEGHWIGKAEWTDLRAFKQGRAAVFSESHQRWGYIDKAGNVVIAHKYLGVGSFHRGRAFVQEDHGGTAAWLVIDLDGNRITGPWAEIDQVHADNLVVQAMEDAGTSRWSLLDEDGRVLVEPTEVPPDERFRRRGEPDLVAEAAYHLSTLWRARRDDLALAVRHLPLKDRVERFRPMSERDLVQLGVWRRRVCARGSFERLQLHGLGPSSVGILAAYYPVTLSIFRLEEEAPVTFERENAPEICIGIPWADLTLLDPERSP